MVIMNLAISLHHMKVRNEGKKNILDHLHDGSILLLHAISKTNADILGEVIDEARKSGYEFYLLH